MKSIIKLAREAGFGPRTIEATAPYLERFAALVRAQALEEAATIAEEELTNSNALAAYNTAQRIRALKGEQA